MSLKQGTLELPVLRKASSNTTCVCTEECQEHRPTDIQRRTALKKKSWHQEPDDKWRKERGYSQIFSWWTFQQALKLSQMSQKVHKDGKLYGKAQNMPSGHWRSSRKGRFPWREYRMNELGRWALRHAACSRNWFQVVELDPSAFNRHKSWHCEGLQTLTGAEAQKGSYHHNPITWSAFLKKQRCLTLPWNQRMASWGDGEAGRLYFSQTPPVNLIYGQEWESLN